MIAFRRNIYALVFFTFLLMGKVGGQPKVKVEYYSTEQGLSHQRVTAVLRDKEGFMWFGSWDGINRFDGRAFVSYKSFPGDKYQLGSDRVDNLVEDESDHLWIQAYDGQIYRFDKKSETFLPLSGIFNPSGNKKIRFSKIHNVSGGLIWLQSVHDGLFCIPQQNPSQGRFIRYRKDTVQRFSLPSDKINFFHKDKERRVWLGTPDGLCCLEPSAGGVYINKNLVPAGVAINKNFTAVEEDNDKVYFSTGTGHLITFDKRRKTFSGRKFAAGGLNSLLRSRKNNTLYGTSSQGEIVILDLSNESITVAKYPTAETLYSLYEDHKGKLWIEPEKRGAIRFDPLNRSFRSFSLNTGESLNYIGNRFRILEDSNGTIWVNMKEGGFGYYNEDTESVEYILKTPDAANYHLPAIVYSIYYDKAGILWLTTNERELVKIVLQRDNFKQQLLTNSSGWSDNEVRGLLYDNKNRIWVGAKRGNLYVYQNNKLLPHLFINTPAEGLGGIYSILQDRRGNIWMGTKGKGLYKAVPVNKEETRYQLTHFVMNKSDGSGLPCNEIYSLLEDQQGRIWIGSFDNGLVLIKDGPGETKFTHISGDKSNYPVGAFQKIRNMADDSKGRLWIGTTDGLVVLDAGTQQSKAYDYKTYSKEPGNKESIGNNDIQYIFRDVDNRMWLATSGGGFGGAIGKAPLQSLKFKNYTTKDGLPNDYVLSCTDDGQHNLWIATENGLSRFNPRTGLFRNYDAYDGLPKIAFSEASACRQPTGGQLAFGTRHGCLFFNPDHLKPSLVTANIALTNLQINNEDVWASSDQSILQTGINYVSDLTLKHNQSIISVDYAILDHRAGGRHSFSYRLLGFDSAWHDDRLQRRATYTNLPPGHYVFEVKSISPDLYSSQPYKRLNITILPPPWKTWWAYLLYAAALGLLLYFIRRYALAMIELRNKVALEQKLAALKLNFFTNISHELRTPLTLIVGPLEQMAKKGRFSPEMNGYVEVARKNAGRMVRFINQLLDLRKVQSNKGTLRISRVEVVGYVREIAAHFSEAAGSKHITLDVMSHDKELFVWVDAEKLDVIIYNLLSNAVKFTPEKKPVKIFIRAYAEQRNFSIAVHDQGPGVPEDRLEDIFELFQEVETRGERSLKGTGIGLALCREFAELHGGSINARNNEEGGLTVTLQLNTGYQHYKSEGVSFVEMAKPVPDLKEPVQEKMMDPVLSPQPVEKTEGPLLLLVEDNDDLRTFIRTQLSGHYKVETACDGEEGLQKAISLMPDLIVSDIMMPKMDGIQMLDCIKNNTSISHIPVVLLSARYSVESRIEGLNYGADCYITKPFDADFLTASINNLLLQRKKLFEAWSGRERPASPIADPIVITSRDELFLQEVIRVVEDKMTDASFNIESIAGTMAMSYPGFYKKFKSLTGLAPVEFVRDRRLQRAVKLLDAGGNNISEVAYLAGFSNPKYFSTCFKDKYEITPSEYSRKKSAQNKM